MNVDRVSAEVWANRSMLTRELARGYPTMLLWGADDPHFGPPWARRLARDIPGVQRVELLDGAGHLLMEDQPERVAELLAEFLAAPTDAQ